MGELIELLRPYKIIATVGLCKNAGKTTVLNYLLNHWTKDKVIGITSIGYDGEAIDGVTMLAKPRIYGRKGLLVATCQSCLLDFKGTYELLESTNYRTPLGQVVIARLITPSEIELAGPSVVSELGDVCRRMIAYGCHHVIADGAAGRMSYATQVDGAIFSVGAAYSQSMKKVVDASGYKVQLLALKEVDCPIQLPVDRIYRKKIILGISYYCFRGLLADKDLEEIMLKAVVDKTVLVVINSAAIFLSEQMYNRFIDQGGTIQVIDAINLLALTVNPMSPYGPWFPAEVFRKLIEERTGRATFDIGPVSEPHG